MTTSQAKAEGVTSETRKTARIFGFSVKKVFLIFLIVSILTGSTLTMKSQKAEAICIPCFGCGIDDCLIVPIIVELVGEIFEAIIEENIEDHVNDEENWIVEDFFEDFWVIGLAEMTEFLSAMGMYQMEILGAMLDAKHQLETQRLFWQLHAEAHKDYHPSDEICWMGTSARSLAASEARGLFNKTVLADRTMDRQLGNANMNGAESVQRDKASRWNQFVRTYCDPRDNYWVGPGTGLDLACDHDGPGGAATRGATNPDRKNIDIDFTRMIDEPRTLAVNFEGPSAIPLPADEEDVLAMSSNLYGHNVLTRNISRRHTTSRTGQKLYMQLRSVAAKRSVAQNTYNSIVGMKSEGTSDTSLVSGGPPLTRSFLAAAFKQLMPTGTPDSEIYAVIGENPSYYAQLEVLSKKIYQNPDFFSGLYDKPANIARKSTAMKAIDLMLDRVIYESELRQEMLLSVLLSSYSRDNYRTLNKEITNTQKARD